MIHVAAVDTETTGVGYHDRPFCVSFAWRDQGVLKSECLRVKYEWEFISDRLDSIVSKVYHNAKFDLRMLQKMGFLVSSGDAVWGYTHDTECMSHLLNEQRPKALKRLAKEVLGLETDEEEVLRKERRKLKLTKADGYDKLPWEIVEAYAKKDAEFTLLLYEEFYPKIVADNELARLYCFEMSLLDTLYWMEERGLGVDLAYVDTMCKTLADQILHTELNIKDLVGIEDFNPASWQQVIAAFKERDIEIKDTSKETLEGIDDPLAHLLLSYRHDTKLYSTYFKALREESADGILHPNFRQWGTRGRRFSAGAVEA